MLGASEQLYPLTGFSFDSWLAQRASAAHHSASSFAEFVECLQGAPPDLALACLKQIRLQSSSSRAMSLIADAAMDNAPVFLDQCSKLPLPHPADSEFRFDEATAAMLAQQLVDQTRDGDEILLVGTPTVALAINDLGVDRFVRFVGSDDCVTESLRSAMDYRKCRFGTAAGRQAAIALVDPPWYDGPMRAMLANCARGVVLGGLVWVVVPAIGTKADAFQERLNFLDCANGYGLERTGSELDVTYRTPLFELAALEQQGIARLARWRKSEALELEVRREVTVAAPAPPESPTELTVDGVRLRLTHCQAARPEVLTPISDNEVFPSVSFRAANRDKATLWTSGNRAFDIDAQRALTALAAVSVDQNAMLQGRLTFPKNASATQKAIEPPNRLIHQLFELIDREKSDARRLVGDGAWLSTAKGWRF